MNFTPIKRGVVCPTVMHLKPDGDINLDMIAPLIDWLIEKGVAGIYPFGSTGEGPLFTTDERKAVAAGRDSRTGVLTLLNLIKRRSFYIVM